MSQEYKERVLIQPESNIPVKPEISSIERTQAESPENKPSVGFESVPQEPAVPIQSVVYSPNEEYQKIEGILSEGLAEMYHRLPPEDKVKFKQKGEETASLVWQAISQPKVKIRKIMDLIKKWLQTIPGVNRFFLEQMAKIKADRIMDQIPPGRKIV
ncbi:MAG: hypothetical protein AAB791_01350 [Patescibacteria group bacterium]